MAATLASMLVAGDVILLEGSLGAGKTTFVQGLARALDVVGPVTSPTFALVAEHEGRIPVAHVDCYRLEGPAELEDLALDEPGTECRVTVVEWADRFPGAFGDDWVRVRLRVGADPDERLLELDTAGVAWRERSAALRGSLGGGPDPVG